MDISKNLPKLIGDQCQILYLPRFSNQVILGVAGSGKSIEAICRAIWIGMTYPHDKVLVVSFNKDVNEEIRYKLSAAVDGPTNILVDTIYSYCRDLLNTYKPKPGSILDNLESKHPNSKYTATQTKRDKQYLHKAVQDVKKRHPDSSVWVKRETDNRYFITTEIQWMQDNRMAYIWDNDTRKTEKEKNYLNPKTPRIGRNSRISPDQRRVIYDVYQKYYQIRASHNKFFDMNDIYRLIPDLNIPEADKPKYIIIDEAQDLTPGMFKALRSIIKSDHGYWNVFGDLAQNIFGQRIPWSQVLGTHLSNGIFRLKINYRNTYGIGKLAKHILDYIKQVKSTLGDSVKYMDEPKLNKRYQGMNPKVWPESIFDNNGMYQMLKQFENKGFASIICMNSDDLCKMKSFMNDHNIQYCTQFEKYVKNPHNIFLQTVNQIKGMEFDRVLIYGVDSFDPQQDNPEVVNPNNNVIDTDKMSDSERLRVAERIYVAITRARYSLVLLYKQNPLKFLLGAK